MQKIISALLLITSTTLFNNGAEAINLSFVGPGSSSVGDTFAVNLNVSGLGENKAPSLGGYDVDIAFNSTALSITPANITLGDQLSLGNLESASEIQVVNGKINLAEASLDPAALLNSEQKDEFTIANLEFFAAEAGESTLDLDVNAFADANGQSLEDEVNIEPAEKITITPPEPIIPPSLSPLQASAVYATQQTCVGFKENNDADTAAQKDLFRISCAVTDNFDDPDENFNLDGDELNSAAQNLATEETFAPASLALKSVSGQSTNIYSRLSGIHSGVMGFSVNSANLNSTLSDDGVFTGGAAGDETIAMSERLGGFLNVIGRYGESDQTDREDEYDFDTQGMTLGLDYRITEQVVAGLAFGYERHDLDFQESALVAGGSVTSNHYSGSIYSTYTQGDLYVDGILTYTDSSYDIKRRIFIESNTSAQGADRKASSDPDGHQIAVGLGSGYNFNYGALSLTPSARVSYLNIQIDSYEESGAGGLNLNVEDQNAESFQTILGGQISYVFNQSFGVIIPQVGIDWHHEYLDTVRTVNATYVNDPRQNVLSAKSDDIDRDFANLNISVSGVFPHGVQAYLAYDTLLGSRNFESNTFTAGVRVSF